MKDSKQHQTWICGHLRPDTDSIVSAQVYADLINLQRQANASDYPDGEQNCLPIRLGPVTRQTEWLFKNANTPLPEFKEDFRWRVKDICSAPALFVDLSATLGDVIRLITSKQVSVVPVVDEQRRLKGILSDRLPMGHYFYHFNMEDFLGALFQIEDLVQGLGLLELFPMSTKPDGKLCLEPSKLEAGDVLLCGSDIEDLRLAIQRNASAVITAQTHLTHDWKNKLKYPDSNQEKRVGVYQFKGSLLALTSQLSLAIPVRNLMASDFETLNAEWNLDEAMSVMQKVPYACPVVDEQDRLIGVMSHGDILNAKSRDLILVDHFEKIQAGAGVEDSNILEIVDHHRVGNLETLLPVRVDCRPLGSTATIVALKFEENQLKPSNSQALLLLGAIVADTLLLTSPTTTSTDRVIANRLAEIASVDLMGFGLETLKQNDELHTQSAEFLLDKDLKSFPLQEASFAVAQLETVDLDKAMSKADLICRLLEVMELRRSQRQWRFMGMLITDVLSSNSLWLVAAEAKTPTLEKALQAWTSDKIQTTGHAQTRIWRQCVSRKKQVIPALLKAFR